MGSLAPRLRKPCLRRPGPRELCLSIDPMPSDAAAANPLVAVGLAHAGIDPARIERARIEDVDGPAGTQLGRVRRVDRGECDLVTADGDLRVLSDSQRAQSDTAPATGDWVLAVDDPDLGPRIDAVLDRRTALVRRDPAEEVVEQVMVANMDFVGVVCGMDRPFNVARIERFLVLASDSGATPFIVVTKTDLKPRGEEWATIQDEFPEVQVIRTSAVQGSGLGDITSLVSDHRTLVLLGESGAGKSALVNALVGEERQVTGSVRSGDSKGRHTTTARELVVIPGGGVLIDTPGIRGVGLWDAGPALERVFSDISTLAVECRFSDCSHAVEPGCAVQEAVTNGTLKENRYVRYLRLIEELAEQAELREERRRRQRGRRRRS